MHLKKSISFSQLTKVKNTLCRITDMLSQDVLFLFLLSVYILLLTYFSLFIPRFLYTLTPISNSSPQSNSPQQPCQGAQKK